MEKCSLCGGKIIDGRCQDCGMPYPTEKRYTLRGESAHTHEVNDEKILHRVRLTSPSQSRPEQPPRDKVQPLYQRKLTGRAPLGSQQKNGLSLKRLVWGIVFFVLALNVLQWILAAATQ